MSSLCAGTICQSDVMTIPVTASPIEAALVMTEVGVGCLIAVDGSELSGMVTDRDLAIRVVGHRDPETTVIGDVMSEPLLCVNADEGVDVVVELMKRNGIRRVPVLQGGELQDGELVGIIALDDLVQDLAWEMGDLGKETQSMIRRAKRIGTLDRIQREIDRKLHEAYRSLQYTNWVARDRLLSEIDHLREKVREAVHEVVD